MNIAEYLTKLPPPVVGARSVVLMPKTSDDDLPDETESQQCSTCKDVKHISEFHRNNYGKPRNECKACQLKRDRRNRLERQVRQLKESAMAFATGDGQTGEHSGLVEPYARGTNQRMRADQRKESSGKTGFTLQREA